jgi:predicted RND superfamily exporter protein
MSGWAGWAHRSRWSLAAALLSACAVLGWHAQGLQTDPSNSALIVRSGPAYRTYQEFRRRFGSDHTVIVGVHIESGISREALARVARLTQRLSALPHVQDARSPATLTLLEARRVGPPGERPIADWLAERPDTGRALAALLRAQTLDGPLLVGEDGTLALIVARLQGDEGDHRFQHETVAAVRRILDAESWPEARFFLSGTSVEQDVVVERIEADRRRFVPITIAVIAALLVLSGAGGRSLAYAGLVMAGAFAATEGAMAVSGARLNPVTVLVAPIILIVAVGYTVQLSGAFAYVGDATDPPARLTRLFQTMAVPSFLAMATTVIGFLSLLASEVPAEREFARFGALGTTAAWTLALGCAPLMVSWMPRRRARRRDARQRRWVGLARWTTRHAIPILFTASALVTASVVSAPRIVRSTHLLHALPPSDPFRRDTERLQQAMGGVHTLDLMLRFPQPGALRQPPTWHALERFQRELTGRPVVSHAFSLVDVLATLKRLLRQDQYAGWWLARVWDALPAKMGADLSRWLRPEESVMRVVVFLRASDTSQVTALADEVPRLAAQTLPEGWHVEATGVTLLLARMSQRLVHDEIASLAVGFGAIFVVAWLTLRSATYALVTLLPNVVPVAGLFGMMATWPIPLNTATAMIATVALGLVFDNTIYIVSRYRQARAAGAAATEAIATALSRCARPVLIASIILAGGFSVTITGSLLPTRHFGMLTCATIGLALATDLLVLPALLAVVKPKA